MTQFLISMIFYFFFMFFVIFLNNYYCLKHIFTKENRIFENADVYICIIRYSDKSYRHSELDMFIIKTRMHLL